MAHMIRVSYDYEIPSERTRLFIACPQFGPRVVLISGGRGASSIAQSLKVYTYNSSYIVTMYDDGGSSKVIREAFDMPPPGDLRNLLMHMADETDQGSSEIIRIFTHRLSRTEYDPEILQRELNSFILLSHPKMLAIERGLANVISLYLDHFNKMKPKDFDLRGASVGNLVMVGCYLLHGRNLENAVFLISSLAKVRGSVIPVTLGNYYLGAELEDGKILYGQANISNQGGQYQARIRRVFFTRSKTAGSKESKPEANERAKVVLAEADVIVYSLGSFYTSIIPTIMTTGIAEAIRSSSAPKIFIANSTSDDETRGLTLSQMLSTMGEICKSMSAASGRLTNYIQYVMANDHGDSDTYRGAGNYIPVDSKKIDKLGVKLLEYPLETAHGIYDSDLISRIILSFAHL